MQTELTDPWLQLSPAALSREELQSSWPEPQTISAGVSEAQLGTEQSLGTDRNRLLSHSSALCSFRMQHRAGSKMSYSDLLGFSLSGYEHYRKR